jgi:hypothetical protein
MQHYGIKFASGQWFSPGTSVSSTNKTDWHPAFLMGTNNIVSALYILKKAVGHGSPDTKVTL